MYALNRLNSYDYNSAFVDPRLISSAHSGQQLTLDAPVLNGRIRMKDVYSISFPKIYNNFSDINSGQISYYFDSEIGQPFIKPLFDESENIRCDYYDPMGAYKPHFERDNSKVCGDGLTWLRDTQFHREDIMAKQQWKRNQTYPFDLNPHFSDKEKW